MLAGKIDISMVSSNTEGQYIQITIHDTKARVAFVSARLSFQELTRALIGEGSVPCRFETHGLDLVGKTEEMKTVMVPLLFTRFGRAEFARAMREVVAQYEVDDWLADGYGLDDYNPNQQAGGQYKVTFRKWV